MGKLTETMLRRVGSGRLGDGVHSDGAGLYLRVQGENRSWLFHLFEI